MHPVYMYTPHQACRNVLSVCGYRTVPHPPKLCMIHIRSRVFSIYFWGASGSIFWHISVRSGLGIFSFLELQCLVLMIRMVLVMNKLPAMPRVSTYVCKHLKKLLSGDVFPCTTGKQFCMKHSLHSTPIPGGWKTRPRENKAAEYHHFQQQHGMSGHNLKYAEFLELSQNTTVWCHWNDHLHPWVCYLIHVCTLPASFLLRLYVNAKVYYSSTQFAIGMKLLSVVIYLKPKVLLQLLFANPYSWHLEIFIFCAVKCFQNMNREVEAECYAHCSKCAAPPNSQYKHSH